jgi:hypothetical protein
LAHQFISLLFELLHAVATAGAARAETLKVGLGVGDSLVRIVFVVVAHHAVAAATHAGITVVIEAAASAIWADAQVAIEVFIAGGTFGGSVVVLGLGMRVVMALAKQLGGNITHRSGVDGTEFILSIPICTLAQDWVHW